MTTTLPEVELDLLHHARRGNRRAVERMLEIHFPAVHRLAHALTARDDAARRVLHFVLTRSLQVLPNWTQEGAPTRWFYHHTVLSARREKQPPPYPSEDPLFVQSEGQQQTPYLAFLRALRALPVQQKEAFILNHGEGLDTRFMGIAMDCSREAAEQHLLSATQSLQPIAGDQYDSFVTRLSDAYHALTPPAHVIVPQVRRHVSRHLLPRRVKRWFGLLVLLIVLVVLMYVVWRMAWMVEA